MSRAIKKKAKDGTIEVEDILRVAKSPSEEKAELLRGLTTKYRWQHAPCFPKVPLATWAEVVSIYCHEGFEGLVELAKNSEKYPFVLGLLEEIPSDQALAATLEIGKVHIGEPAKDLESSFRLASTINLLGLKKIRPQHEERIRNFLHRLLSMSIEDHKCGSVMLTLRWYGDEKSIEIIRRVPEMSADWEHMRRHAIRSIKRRQKSG